MARRQDNICQGYDYDFVDNVPDEYICKICHLPIRKPVQTTCCGNRFCKDCLQEANKRKERPKCPMDRQTLDIRQDVFDDKGAERTVNSFHIKCPSQGCNWQGELGNVENHTKFCPQLTVKCPNDCGKQTTNEKIADHADNECPLTKIPCTYHRFGCQFMVRRKDMDDHMEKGMKDHLALTFERLALASDRLETLKDENEKLNEALGKVQEQAIPCTNKFVWKINNIKKKLEDAKSGNVTLLYSDPFYTEKYGYKLRVQLNPNGNTAKYAGYISIYYYLLRGEYDASLPWPFPKDVTFTLVDQKEILTNRKNKKMTATHKDALTKALDSIQRPTTDSNKGFGFLKFVSHETLMSKNYIVDNSIFISVDVTDPPASYIHGILT